MWPRHLELAFALWLMASPFVFSHPESALALWWVDLAGGAVAACLAVTCHWRPLRRAHLLLLPLGLALVGWGWWAGRGEPAAPPPQQNHIVVGLLLAMFSIIPSQASRPPGSWRRYYDEASRGGRPAGR